MPRMHLRPQRHIDDARLRGPSIVITSLGSAGDAGDVDASTRAEGDGGLDER